MINTNGWYRVIDPSGIFYVYPGTPVSFSFKPGAGALIKNLTIHGVKVVPKPVSNFSIASVNQSYDVRLHCVPLPGIIIAAFRVTSAEGNSVQFAGVSWGSPYTWNCDYGDG